MLWLVVVAVLAAGLTAVLADVPSAAFVLAALCAVLAVVRGTDRRPPEAFRARSTSRCSPSRPSHSPCSRLPGTLSSSTDGVAAHRGPWSRADAPARGPARMAG